MKSRLLSASLSAAVASAMAVAVSAQPPGNPAFEAASVKANKSGTMARSINMPGDRFEAVNVPLLTLVAFAYGESGPQPRPLSNDRIVAGPNWMNTDAFDVAAKAHSDGKLGSRLERAAVDCESMPPGRGSQLSSATGAPPACYATVSASGTLRAAGHSMTTLATMFSRLTNRPVMDETGLTGPFNADLDFNPDGLTGLTPPPDAPPASAPPPDAPSFFTALQEQLGLRLESTTGPVDVLVIDHVERPTED
jgi:hypothetical protein